MATNITSLPIAIYMQGGNGIPNHISPKGTEYTDLDTAIVYINKDGVATWAEFLDSTYSFTGGTTSFTGGTVSGATFFSGGLSATTFSATTYLGLPIISSDYLPLSGGTVSGSTNFTSGLTANTFSLIDPTTTFNIVGNIFGQTSLTSPTGAIVLTPGIYGVQVNGAFPDLTVNGTITSGGLSGIGTRMVVASSTGLLSTQDIPNGFTGGTVTGATNFTNGLTANTFSATSINMVDYIVFNTGTTSAATVAGTVYFDNVEKSLSYNTSINQGVTVNLGQQNYVRVFNNSGFDIPRGKALEVLLSYSGLPSATLAVNKHEGFYVIGVSSELIPNNSEGIAITNGIISNIELTGMTIGSLVYASDTIPGDLVDSTLFLDFPLTARTNEIGYVVQTGVTTGKLFVNIFNENTTLSLTELERNVLEGNTLSTGLFDYTGMTVASSTTFNVSPLKGWLVKNTYEYSLSPDVQSVNYSGGTNISVTNILTADSTYVLINSGLTVTQQTTLPTPQQRRENIYLGKINHPNRTSILNINNQADYDVSPMSSLRDLWFPIKLINQNISPSPNGSNLSFNTSAGTVWGNGINWHNNQLSPNSISISAKTPASFFYRTQTGGTSGLVTVINPTKYDVGGVITSVGGAASARATNQRIYLYPTGVINVLYGQQYYANLTAAVAGVQSEVFTPYPNAESTGILIGVLSVRNDIVADGQYLTNPNYAKFTLVSKFGESFGGTGGLSTTTLQQAYDNSTTPEISINSTLGALSVINGTANADNITNLFDGVDATNNLSSFIRADGLISGSSLATPSFSAGNTSISATTILSPTLDNLFYDKFMTNQYACFLPSDNSTTYSGLRTAGGTILSTGTVSTLTENPMGILFTTPIAVGSVAAQYGTVFGVSSLGVNFEFETIRKFRINTNNGAQRIFVGISSLYSTSAPTNVDPLSLINSIGVAKLQSGGTLNFVWNDASGTASYLDLGPNFLGTATTVTYKLKISKTFGVAAINLELTRITNSTGAVLVTGTTITSDYNTGVSYYPVAWMGNNTGVSGAVSFKDYGCQLFKRNAISS
jgi:hypothetical protein